MNLVKFESTYQVKGCPHCGGKPLLFIRGAYLVLECPSHKEFIVGSMRVIESYEAINVLSEDTNPPDPLSIIDSIIEMIREWNNDEIFIYYGADYKKVSSRGAFSITLSTR